jgi:DNA invertase Pin-like site-specific DNA recombinase
MVITSFAAQHDYKLAGKYIEVETGKGHDALARRPKLVAALAHAKKLKASVVGCKLCRLGCDVHFISGLMSNRVPFIVAELGPEVDPFMLHIYAAVAQKERSLIAARTAKALQATKRCGVKLGKTGRQRAKEANRSRVEGCRDHVGSSHCCRAEPPRCANREGRGVAPYVGCEDAGPHRVARACAP